ncbi:MAG: S41 family peptidase, partial [Caldilineaceae bacterium]
MQKLLRSLQKVITLLILAGLFAAPNSALIARSALAQDLPPADIAADEGGAQIVTGEWSYSNFAVASVIQEPVVALLDIGPRLQGDYNFIPRTSQILGLLTSPMTPSPATYQVMIPQTPAGSSVDLDNDSELDAGVQVYQLIVGTNMVGDSYLEQLEQDGYSSVLSDPRTGALTQGTLLVYAPDDAQGFPRGAGDDGVLFTGDDPAVSLPAGYTLVSFNTDGDVSFDRAQNAVMNTLEPPSEMSPDFSDQGITDSFNSLIDVLAQRYSYTELRNLDWEAIRAEYLPQIEAAEAADSIEDYYVALYDLAMSIRDSHVAVSTRSFGIGTAPVIRVLQQLNGSLGAGVVELSDGRFIVNYVDPSGPAAEAGWVFGTEIVSVDGAPLAERIATMPLFDPESTPEGIRLAQIGYALSFPAGAETTIEYRQPGETELKSIAMTAAEGAATSDASTAAAPRPEISFETLPSGYGYIQWDAFNDPLYKLAVWEKFLSTVKTAPGIILDMRNNVGGSQSLFMTLASYLFTEDAPAQMHWIDEAFYDETVGDFVTYFQADADLYSPKPELTYTGIVVVLVNENTVSSGEYFPQFLQNQGRAIIVGQHGTDGAGGPVERASLPGEITFQFTKGRTFFAGTDELNLEAKGVTLDVRVPVTEESVQAVLAGEDPVLDAAIV